MNAPGARPPDQLDPEHGSRARLTGLLLGVGALVFALVMWMEPWFYATLAALPACAQLHWMQRTVLVLLVLVVLPAPLLWRYAGRVARAGQFPLSGRWLWRRTPVSRGRSVRVLIALLRGLALLLALTWLCAVVLFLVRDPFGAPMTALHCTEGTP